MTQGELIQRLGQCKTWKQDLSPMEHLAQRLGNPQKQLKFIHVAGTNGKGSTCAMVSSVLQQAGYRTGRFVSPYILEFRERIQVNGEMIPEEALCTIGEQVLTAIAELEKEGIYPTEFDAVTMIGFLWFVKAGCDLVVLEVGVGGTIDSTNIVDSESVLVSVITSISLDHTAILGDTPGEIAAEKSGILKQNGVTVLSDTIEGEALSVIQSVAKERNNQLIVADSKAVSLLEHRADGMQVMYRDTAFFLPMPGLYQLHNAAVALAVLEQLRQMGWTVPFGAMVQGLEQVRFPARMELIGRSPYFWVDGAHNPEGISALLETLKDLPLTGKRVCINGMMMDKNCPAAVALLAEQFDYAVTVKPKNSRAMAAEELQKLWQAQNVPTVSVGDDMEQAIVQAIRFAGDDGAVICCGSLFLCADLRPIGLRYFQQKTNK